MAKKKSKHTEFLKFRVSKEFLQLMAEFKPKSFIMSDDTDSEMYRLLILEGAVRNCSHNHDDMRIKIQEAIHQKLYR